MIEIEIKMWKVWTILCCVAVMLLAATFAFAQSIGGNATIAVTTTTANVQLPASLTAYPVVLLAQPTGQTQEVFFAFGQTNAVVATAASPALPPNGSCYNVGSNGWVAAIVAATTATLRITQMTNCPPR